MIRIAHLPACLARRLPFAAIAIGALLLLSRPAHAQSFQQYALADWVNQTSGTLTFTNLTGAGHVLVVGCGYKPLNGHCTSVPTDSEGNTFMLASTKETPSGNAGQKVYYAVNIAGGTHDTVTCYSELIGSISCIGVEIAGVNALDQGSDATQAIGNSLLPTSPTVITTAPNEILLGFGAMNPGSNSTFSAYGAGWTGIVRGSGEVEYRVTSTAGGYNATASVNPADEWVKGIFAFYQAPPISLNPQTIASGFSSLGTVGLSSPAPLGGAIVMLSSSDPSKASVPASVVVPAGTYSAHFVVTTNAASPSATITISATYASVTNSASLAIRPVNPSIRYSLWSSSAAPTVADDGTTSPEELGVKFSSDSGGFISGIRFYKSVANTGTHYGNLWNSSGQLLATATFTGESASGWQEVSFASPVAIDANVLYTASYHTDAGHTADDHFYFTSIGVDNLLLHAPASGTAGGNGVVAVTTGNTFPQTTLQDSNYWVDVVFLESTPPPALLSLVLNPTKVSGGQDSTGTVTLTVPAPPGGTTIALASANHTLASVPISVTVLAGATSKTFAIKTFIVKQQQTVDISASLGAVTKHATLTLAVCQERDPHIPLSFRPCFVDDHGNPRGPDGNHPPQKPWFAPFGPRR